ncbi:MAG TPA: hypothetical protein DC049_19900 [Spirochaetia bacterium]|nr:hypothetical protein [Spirochaetia bacterium]
MYRNVVLSSDNRNLLQFQSLEPFIRDDRLFRYKIHLDGEIFDRILSLAFSLVDIFNRAEYRVKQREILYRSFEVLLRTIILEYEKLYPEYRPRHNFIKVIIDYISRNLTEKINLDSLAAITGLTKQYISSAFKEKLKISIIDYINNEKIQYACNLLDSTDKSIYEIMSQSGFNSVSNFIFCFKKHMNTTPGRYRNKSWKK